ncbi:hypothetical protein GF369_04435 [Candidatus Peregrinibacteria bacterium]|nr:hypothetical protein [Candidatus Peregrinibacteria bacterium]
MLRKGIALISALIIMVIGMPYVYAQDTGNSSDVQDIQCSNLQENQSSGLYVILEEPLGGPKAKYCFRVCTKLDNDKANMTNKCEYKETCEGGGDLGDDVTCQRVQVLKAESGGDLIYSYVRMIYLWAAGTIGIIAVFTLVYSGIGISAAGGDSGKIDNYKNRIMQSLIGLVILFLSGLILYTINPTFFV